MLEPFAVGARVRLVNLTCARVSHYERTDRFANIETTRLIWRYAFYDQTQRKFVYSGVPLRLVQPAVVLSLTATVKRGTDAYGFIRLSRIAGIEIGETPQFV